MALKAMRGGLLALFLLSLAGCVEPPTYSQFLHLCSSPMALTWQATPEGESLTVECIALPDNHNNKGMNEEENTHYRL